MTKIKQHVSDNNACTPVNFPQSEVTGISKVVCYGFVLAIQGVPKNVHLFIVLVHLYLFANLNEKVYILTIKRPKFWFGLISVLRPFNTF